MEKELFTKPNYFKYPLIIFCGFGLALASLMGKISPFGTVFIACMNGTDCLSAFAGTALGYLLRGDFVAAVPTVAAGAAICVLRIFFVKPKGAAGRLISGGLAGAAVLFTNIISVKSASDILLSFAFGLIATISCCTFLGLNEKLKKGDTSLHTYHPVSS